MTKSKIQFRDLKTKTNLETLSKIYKYKWCICMYNYFMSKLGKC